MITRTFKQRGFGKSKRQVVTWVLLGFIPLFKRVTYLTHTDEN